MAEQQIKETWDKFWKEKEGTTEFEKELHELLVTKADEFKGQKILEAGCGTGRGLMPFLEKGCECYGVDISEESVKLAKSQEINGKRINAVLADARKMPFKDNFFDFAFNSGVIEHFNYPEDLKIVSEMVRTTRQKVMVIVPNKRCMWYMFGKKMFQLVGKWPYGYEGSYTPDDISRIGKEAGLVGIKVYGLLYYIPSNIGFTKIYPAAWSPFFKKASAFLSKLGALRFLFAYAIVMEGAKQ